MSTIDERLMALMADALPYRELAVSISRADERRLARHIVSINHACPDDPLSPHDDCDLALALMGCALTGLSDGEEEDGVWSDVDGRCFDLPRRVRAPWTLRLRFAVRAAVRVWRAS